MRRRDFIAGLGGAAVWPVAARAQQTARPVVGIQYVGSATDAREALDASLRGLAESGFIDGQNVKLEYRFADGQYDRLPRITAALTGMRVSVLAALGSDIGARLAKEATKTTPIVFAIGGDPVQLGLVSSLARPASNVTGATWLTGGLAAKRLGMLRYIVPAATAVGMLVNPDNSRAAFETKDAEEAGRAIGWEIVIRNARAESDFEPAFESFAEHHAAALLVVGDSFFFSRRQQIAALAARRQIPAIYSLPEYAEAGGLMSYGGSSVEAYHTAGVYVGRILKGAKPADLPVQLPSKFELVINMNTVKALGLSLPSGVIAITDRVIE
jgi:putative tryptophan/tyrosine transport system substrate-binding protein